MLKALIWDVDGTLAETERDGHRVAFNQAFDELDLPWHWSVPEYGRLLRVAGGFERVLAYMDERTDVVAGTEARRELAGEIHRRKNRHYATLVAQGGLVARPGVMRLFGECRELGIAQAVATTTSRSNVEALFPRLFGEAWQQLFAVVLCAEDAPRKKPDPQVYQRVVERLGCTPAAAIAIEDSPAGLASAQAAGVACVVTASNYFSGVDYAGAACVCGDLDTGRVDVAALQAILRERVIHE
jgi:HAD superfamily hydrolase (TIGR01509 family)